MKRGTSTLRTAGVTTPPLHRDEALFELYVQWTNMDSPSSNL